MVRLATIGDAAIVGRLLHDFNTEYEDVTPGPERLAARIAELIGDGDTDVLIAGGEPPCALAVLRLRKSIWTADLECYLAELYVAPDRRGQGIGRELMSAAIDHARTRGATYMDLGTAETDTAARALYESLGFSNREGRSSGPVNHFYERDL
jgi:ribosomal protein S18 acetylase RimI-like enzyme